MSSEMESDSLLDKLDSIAPIQRFDAFPKLPATYKSRSSGGGFVTLGVVLLSLLLVLNDFHELIWGWPDQEFAVDKHIAQTLNLNVDMVVNMPCQFLSVDIRDAVGDRLHLSSGFSRDGTIFDVRQATAMQDYQTAVSASDVVSTSRRNRGFFAWLGFGKSKALAFPPTYNYRPDGSACRVYGSIEVKKVTANLHITTLGHGYGSYEHTDHSIMNLSHIITEFSFGAFYPGIVQPLDYSFEVTQEPFSIFQYFLTVVPTTYYPARSRSLTTSQYSVTHYVRHVEHGRGTPGIFFKFDMDPMSIEVHQRTTTLIQFLLRVVGVIGGVWTCASWGFKVGERAVRVVTGSPDDGTITAEATVSGRKSRWTGGSLNKRKGGGSWSDQNQIGGWNSPGPNSAYGTPVPGSAFGPGTPASPFPQGGPFLGQVSVPPSPRPTSMRNGSSSSQLNGATPYSSNYPSSPGPGTPSFSVNGASPAPSPYSPSFPRSVSGGSAGLNVPTNGIHIPPAPHSPVPASPRPPSGLNPNRVSIGGSKRLD